jgi:hypothetical protein
MRLAPDYLIRVVRVLIDIVEDTIDHSDPAPITHPSLRPTKYESVSPAIHAKHQNPYLGPKRIRTAEFYRSRYVSKRVKKLPKTLPF